ncbi:MAG: glycosyltransferase family 2 protein [Patescibacteria group bacterium]
MLQTSIIIPVYKKLDLFRDSLLNNLKYFGDSGILIINDDPNSRLPSDLKIDIPIPANIRFIQNEKNLGFAKSVNKAVSYTSSDLIMLLNTDVFLQDDKWIKALEVFEKNPKLFAISFAQDDGTGHVSGRNQIYFRNGLFHHSGLEIDSNHETYNMNLKSTKNNIANRVDLQTSNFKLQTTCWAEGGSSIFRKSLWDKLGGFDEAYSPFYWEDVDLSFSAKKNGYEVYFAKDIRVLHKHESTIGSYYDKEKINKIAYEHQIYFTRKHADTFQKFQFYKYLIKQKIKKIINQ